MQTDRKPRMSDPFKLRMLGTNVLLSRAQWLELLCDLREGAPLAKRVTGMLDTDPDWQTPQD